MYHPELYNYSVAELRKKLGWPIQHNYYTIAMSGNLPDAEYWYWVVSKLREEQIAISELSKFSLDSTQSTAVDANYHWQPMETCPRGCKVQLLGGGGVAMYGVYNGTTDWYEGWAPLPTTRKE